MGVLVQPMPTRREPVLTARGIVPLERAGSAAVALVGAKAANLGRALAAGLPVFPGFTLTTAAVAALASRPGLEPVVDAWAELSGNGDIPLVVRSSSPVEDQAGSSMAGRFTSVVDVRGWAAFRDAVAAVARSAGDDAAGTVLPHGRPRPAPPRASPVGRALRARPAVGAPGPPRRGRRRRRPAAPRERGGRRHPLPPRPPGSPRGPDRRTAPADGPGPAGPGRSGPGGGPPVRIAPGHRVGPGRATAACGCCSRARSPPPPLPPPCGGRSSAPGRWPKRSRTRSGRWRRISGSPRCAWRSPSRCT